MSLTLHGPSLYNFRAERGTDAPANSMFSGPINSMFSGPINSMFSGPINSMFSGPMTYLLSMPCVLMKILSHDCEKDDKKAYRLKLRTLLVVFM